MHRRETYQRSLHTLYFPRILFIGERPINSTYLRYLQNSETEFIHRREIHQRHVHAPYFLRISCIGERLIKGMSKIRRFLIKGTSKIWQFPPKMLHPRNPPDRETQIPQYRFKFNQDHMLNLCCEILRHLSFRIWWISGMLNFQWKVSYGDSRFYLFKRDLSKVPPYFLIRSWHL